MRITTFLVVITSVFTIVIRPLAYGSDKGRLCLAPVPQPTNGEKTLANSTGGNPDVTYTLRLDEGEWIEIGQNVTWINDLDLDKKHLITIRADKKQIESFYFTFDADHPDLCLFLKSLYLTWELWPVEKTGEWCPCYANDN